jgi:hypothetical protein
VARKIGGAAVSPARTDVTLLGPGSKFSLSFPSPVARVCPAPTERPGRSHVLDDEMEAFDRAWNHVGYGPIPAPKTVAQLDLAACLALGGGV